MVGEKISKFGTLKKIKKLKKKINKYQDGQNLSLMAWTSTYSLPTINKQWIYGLIKFKTI